MASDYRNRGSFNDVASHAPSLDDDDRLVRPSGGGGVGTSSIAYESGRGRSSKRKIVASLVVVLTLGGFAAVMWNAYNQGQQTQGNGVVPLIQAENAPAKVKPEQPGGMDVPNQDKLIYDRLTPGQAPPNTIERLLPPPESPVARPQAPQPLPAVTESLLPEAATARPANDIDIVPPTIAPRAQANIAPAAPTIAAAPTKAAPSAPAATVAALPPAASKAANGAFRVQLGAVRSQDAAQKEWSRLQAAHSDLLGRLGLTVSQADLGDRGTFYRVQAGPFGEHQAAADLCTKLKSRNVSCIIVRP